MPAVKAVLKNLAIIVRLSLKLDDEKNEFSSEEILRDLTNDLINKENQEIVLAGSSSPGTKKELEKTLNDLNELENLKDDKFETLNSNGKLLIIFKGNNKRNLSSNEVIPTDDIDSLSTPFNKPKNDKREYQNSKNFNKEKESQNMVNQLNITQENQKIIRQNSPKSNSCRPLIVTKTPFALDYLSDKPKNILKKEITIALKMLKIQFKRKGLSYFCLKENLKFKLEISELWIIKGFFTVKIDWLSTKKKNMDWIVVLNQTLYKIFI